MLCPAVLPPVTVGLQQPATPCVLLIPPAASRGLALEFVEQETI
jgi:hypothetical protein